jgi:hypothetical protein
VTNEELEEIKKRWPSKSAVKRMTGADPKLMIMRAWEDIRALIDHIEGEEDGEWGPPEPLFPA